MRTVEFRHLLNERNALRVQFTIEQGDVTEFVVQLECSYDNEWKPIVRYDTAHDFAHRDTLHPNRKAEKDEMRIQDYNEALTFAIEDLTDNWRAYRRRYEQWLKTQ